MIICDKTSCASEKYSQKKLNPWMQLCSGTQNSLLHTSGSYAMMWNVEKNEEKWILPPSVGASHYTSKESFSLSRHLINHRVVFHHQLLVPSTLVFSALTCEMEWETLEKRVASSRPSHQRFCCFCCSCFIVTVCFQEENVRRRTLTSA